MKIAKDTGSFDKGLTAEAVAANYLQGQGYEILERRFKVSVGEIDLIVKNDNVIAAVEVKFRKSLNDALEVINKKAQRRIANAFLIYIAQHPEYEYLDMRFDVVAITPPLSIHHLDNAWMIDA